MKIGLTFTLQNSPNDGDGSPSRSTWPAGDEEEEFDSPETIQALAAALQQLGHAVTLLGDGEEMIRRLLDGPRPDLVFNLAEGRGATRCREARVPALLEMLGIPYTGADALTLAAALDKDCAKRLVRNAGVATPAWVLIDGDPAQSADQLHRLRLPLVVKPAYEGSSKGILSASLVHTDDELFGAIAQLAPAYGQPLLVEEFIDGDELTVGITGNSPAEILGIMRILPADENTGAFLYGLETKRDYLRRVRYECPARLSPGDTAAVIAASLASWQALGCRDVARIDFRLRDHVPYFLEANPLPGLAPGHSDLVILAGKVGVEYRELISRIVQAALSRLESKKETGSGLSMATGASHGQEPTARVSLRAFRGEDTPRLVEILHRCGMFCPDDIEAARELLGDAPTDPDYCVSVAEDDTGPIGWAAHGLIPLTDATYELYWMAVDPARHGQGVGRALLTGVERQVRAARGRWLVAETSSLPDYSRARSFYTRAGFTDTGSIPDFYRPGEGRIIFAKRLDGEPSQS